MITEGTHTQVLIVGAGPSGLMMAAQLLRYGIQPIIIDSKKGITAFSKALAVHAQTLEIYRQMGIADTAIQYGKPIRAVTINQKNKQLALISLKNVGEGLTPYPYLLSYKQNENEQLLLNYLSQNCCPVYWDTELININQDENRVKVTLNHHNSEVNLTCDWLIGADGMHSRVRQLLKIPFTGKTYPGWFCVADIVSDNSELVEDEMTDFIDKDGFAAFLPLAEKNSFRVAANVPQFNTDPNELNFEHLRPFLKSITGIDVQAQKVLWFSVYQIHKRMADNFRNQHCFLIGDAAHVHSPAGGQGMNTGIQDGYNLAWKLAGVINGNYAETILDSYAAERMPVAKRILKSTDRVFSLIISKNWFVNIFKRHFLPKLLNFVWSKEHFRKAIFKQISQIGINYRTSKLNLHLSSGIKINAGDRLPYIIIYDEKRQLDTDLHEWCSKPGFTLLILGKFEEMFLFNTARWITLKYPNLLNFYYLPPSGKNLAVFEAFEVNPHLQKAIIIRPDMHIGYMNDMVDLKTMDNYLQNVVGIIG